MRASLKLTIHVADLRNSQKDKNGVAVKTSLGLFKCELFLNGLYCGVFFNVYGLFQVMLQNGNIFGGMLNFKVFLGCMPDIPDIYLG